MLGVAAHGLAGIVRERQARQADQRLQRQVRAIHVGADHRQRDFVVFTAGELQVRLAQALVVRLGPREFPQLTRRIRYANDIQALWYLRGDLMAALAAQQGEAYARETIQDISDQFQGLLPRGMSTRPSPLGH